MATTARVEEAGREARGPGLAAGLGTRLVADGFLIVVFLVWLWWAARLPEFVLPSPVKVFWEVVALLVEPAGLVHTITSLVRVVVAVLLALLLGSAMVFLARYLPTTRTLVSGRLTPFFNSFPSFGWAVLAVIWFGISDFTVLFVETAILLPFCMINMWEGLKGLDEELLEMARSFGRSRWKVLRKVVLPLLFPYIFSALKISYGVGWKVSLLVELFGAKSGLGYLLEVARQRLDTPKVFGVIIVVIILVAAMERLVFTPIERRVLRHRAAMEATL